MEAGPDEGAQDAQETPDVVDAGVDAPADVAEASSEDASAD